ncbi:MAG: hypothetical protein M3025_00095 [Actinomycetota bacterium]|nr:hypothetical protein [Actinomycetota bacterium]
MATELEIERILEAVTASLNEHRLEEFDTRRVQLLVTAALGGEVRLRVDDGGGVHEDGVRIGAIRRTSTGEWITERQNREAPGAATDVPAKDQED